MSFFHKVNRVAKIGPFHFSWLNWFLAFQRSGFPLPTQFQRAQTFFFPSFCLSFFKFYVVWLRQRTGSWSDYNILSKNLFLFFLFLVLNRQATYNLSYWCILKALGKVGLSVRRTPDRPDQWVFNACCPELLETICQLATISMAISMAPLFWWLPEMLAWTFHCVLRHRRQRCQCLFLASSRAYSIFSRVRELSQLNSFCGQNIRPINCT